jgi:polar amino acid transport system permease protein
MNRDDPPPPIERRKLTKVDFTLFAGVIFLVVYAVYQVNDVLVYKWNWGRVTNFVIRFDKDSGTYVANLLLHGLATTLRLAVWGTVLATIIGLVMGYWRTCENLTLRIISRCYVELIRNIPPVVFIFIFFFFISSQIFPALGFDNIDPDSSFVDNTIFRIMFGDPVLLSNFLAGMVCLAMFEGAYITEIVRAGIQSIPKVSGRHHAP